MGREIKVLIVDDSAIVRQTISSILSKEEDIKIIGTASDPYFAVNKINEETPDVIILDIEMPKMDGLTFLYKIMTQHPIPVIICSTLTTDGSDSALKAASYGAVDIITKPKIGTKQFLEESSIQLVDSVRAASLAKIKPLSDRELPHNRSIRSFADPVVKKKKSILTETTDKVIVVGASTGGTEALKDFLSSFEPNIPGIVVVQHMPENFTRAFANRLDSICKINVKEAKNGDSVLRGHALIAPGNLHTLLKRKGAQYSVEVKEGPLVSRHRPSVNVLFQSTANNAGKNAVGVIMTGMGNDGATGMKEMKEAGAYNFAQDEESCVVFGMPKEAIKIGAVDKIVPLSRLCFEVSQAILSK